MGVPGVAGQVGERGDLRQCHRVGLERQKNRVGHTGSEHHLRQTLIALASGRMLDEHSNPGDATVHVLHGRIRLASGDLSWDGATGHLIAVPDASHTLEALDDSVVLLTVVNRA